MCEIRFDRLGLADHKNNSQKVVKRTVNFFLSRLFNDAGTIGTAYDKTIDELDKGSGRCVVEVLFRYLPAGGSAENHEEPLLGWPQSLAKFELNTSRI
jgi:hypothetical protein